MTDTNLGRVEPRQTPQVVVRVPGVTTILGEFAFHSQGKVLCCANDQELIVNLFESPDNQIHVFNSYTGDKKHFSPISLKYRKEDKWANYVKGILQQMAESEIKVSPFGLRLEGPILKNDGATLAAAVSIGVFMALKKLIGFEMSDRDIAFKCYRNCTGFCGELTKFSTILTMLAAEKGRYVLFDIDSLKYEMMDDPFDRARCSLLLVDCRIPPTAMREEINHKHIQVRDSFAKLRAIYNRSLKEPPINDLKDRIRIGVMEADIDSDVDARTIAEETGVKSIQLHTGGMCHLTAAMTRQGLEGLEPDELDLAILENVGNLVCPAEFDTGAQISVNILSVPEGDDKPLKYPLMYQVCDVVLINKIDTLSVFDFDLEKAKANVLMRNPRALIFPVSAKTGEGMEAWENWLLAQVQSFQNE